jgi:hypothetical protein
LIAIALILNFHAYKLLTTSNHVERTFYGVIRLENHASDDPRQRTMNMYHGRVLHGSQFQSPDKSMWPTCYFGRDSGIGRTFQCLHEKRPHIKVGIVGLGTGTLAAYGRSRDLFRFYEINDAVIRLAQDQFTFLRQSPAQSEVVLGDARLMLEREDAQAYDLLILDAFSGDSIPAHLLSTEAMQIYTKHLADKGIIAFHISNLHFDLASVVGALVDQAEMKSQLTRGSADEDSGQVLSYWVIASRDQTILSHESLTAIGRELTKDRVLWTDDFSNLFSVLK